MDDFKKLVHAIQIVFNLASISIVLLAKCTSKGPRKAKTTTLDRTRTKPMATERPTVSYSPISPPSTQTKIVNTSNKISRKDVRNSQFMRKASTESLSSKYKNDRTTTSRKARKSAKSLEISSDADKNQESIKDDKRNGVEQEDVKNGNQETGEVDVEVDENKSWKSLGNNNNVDKNIQDQNTSERSLKMDNSNKESMKSKKRVKNSFSTENEQRPKDLRKYLEKRLELKRIKSQRAGFNRFTCNDPMCKIEKRKSKEALDCAFHMGTGQDSKRDSEFFEIEDPTQKE